MFFQLATRIVSTVDHRLLANMAWNFGVKGTRSVHLFKKRLKKGEYFPAFLYLSVLNSCNLRCQGCWVDVDKPEVKIDLDRLNRLVNQAKARGNSFFGILGGEPFLHTELFDFLAAHPDCFFQVFTNGQLITDKKAKLLRKLGNVTPLISIEGSDVVSDERRGKPNVLSRSLRGLDHCLENRLLTGVATSLCQSNIDDLLTEKWLRSLIERGVHYAWYHSYRPVGPKIHPELALTPEQARGVRKFVVEMRARLPIALIDAYYDHKGQALCPMATGISHHISPTGAVEPCPIIQFATENIGDGDIFEVMTGSEFLRDFRETAARHTRGCIVLERPDLVKELAARHGAKDTTLRGTAMAELDAMVPRGSQYLPGEEIPEKHWMYWLGKRLLFHDFGAYGQLEVGGGVEKGGSEGGKGGKGEVRQEGSTKEVAGV
jgi:MoaA/NifB/PqqE/SkfB family radical SAM enzyme